MVVTKLFHYCLNKIPILTHVYSHATLNIIFATLQEHFHVFISFKMRA